MLSDFGTLIYPHNLYRHNPNNRTSLFWKINNVRRYSRCVNIFACAYCTRITDWKQRTEKKDFFSCTDYTQSERKLREESQRIVINL